jgi:hypothetical protein
MLHNNLYYRYNNYKNNSGQQPVMHTRPKFITLETKPDDNLIRPKHIVLKSVHYCCYNYYGHT